MNQDELKPSERIRELANIPSDCELPEIDGVRAIVEYLDEQHQAKLDEEQAKTLTFSVPAQEFARRVAEKAEG